MIQLPITLLQSRIQACTAKVDEPDLVASGDEDVGRAEILVKYAERVEDYELDDDTEAMSARQRASARPPDRQTRKGGVEHYALLEFAVVAMDPLRDNDHPLVAILVRPLKHAVQLHCDSRTVQALEHTGLARPVIPSLRVPLVVLIVARRYDFECQGP